MPGWMSTMFGGERGDCEAKVWGTVSGINSVCHWLSRADNKQHISVTFWLKLSLRVCVCLYVHVSWGVCGGVYSFLFLCRSNSSYHCLLSLLPLCPSLSLILFLLLPLTVSLSRISRPSCTIARPNSHSAARSGGSSWGNWSHASPLCRLTIEKFHYSLSDVSGEMSKREERGKLES